MKVTDRSRLVSRTKPAKPRKRGQSAVGSFREKLDWRWLCASVRARGVAQRDVEDVAQDVLLRASRAAAPPPLKPGQTQRQQRRALLRRIVRLEVWTHLRRERSRRTTPCGTLTNRVLVEPMVEEALEKHTWWMVLDEALDVLKAKWPEVHAVVQAHDLDEEPLSSLAARLGIPMGTAWHRLRRGHEELLAFARRYAAKHRLTGRPLGG